MRNETRRRLTEEEIAVDGQFFSRLTLWIILLIIIGLPVCGICFYVSFIFRWG